MCQASKGSALTSKKGHTGPACAIRPSRAVSAFEGWAVQESKFLPPRVIQPTGAGPSSDGIGRGGEPKVVRARGVDLS